MKKSTLVASTVGLLGILLIAVCYIIFIKGPKNSAELEQFVILPGVSDAQIANQLKSQGFIKNPTIFRLLVTLRGKQGHIKSGGYVISSAMNTWQIVTTLTNQVALVWVTIPEGLRKEEIADIFTKSLNWTKAEEQEFINKDTVSPTDYFEGVYFPDTYLIPIADVPSDVVHRLQAHFQTIFAPYAKQALAKNIKWTTALTLASIIQREAAGKSDMAIISGILWNRLLQNMKLQIDSTVQYARGNTGKGWWAPITPADEKILSPYNTYLYAGLPPHPISNPGAEAINAAINPATTTCLYYIHDSNRQIHCATTYKQQLQNITRYLQ